MAIRNDDFMSFLSNTCAWEQLEGNKDTEEEGKKRRVNMERCTVSLEK